MGQKVRPTGLRLGITHTWSSRWYGNKQDFGTLLVQDQKIRQLIKARYGFAGIPKIEIERQHGGGNINIYLHTTRPGIVIGRKGAELEKIVAELKGLTGKEVRINIVEVNKPELDAQLVAEAIAEQLVKRTNYRRAIKKALDAGMMGGAWGIKVQVSGRLMGADMARRYHQHLGKLPLSTLRAIIDYGFAEAKTTYGIIGVKVWVYKGMIAGKKELKDGFDTKTGKAQKSTAG